MLSNETISLQCLNPLNKKDTSRNYPQVPNKLTQLHVSTRRPVTSCQAFPYAPPPWKQTGWFGSVGETPSHQVLQAYGVMERINQYTCIYIYIYIVKVVSHRPTAVIEEDKNRYYYQSKVKVAQPLERIPDPLAAPFARQTSKLKLP